MKKLLHGDTISLTKDYELNLVFYFLGLKWSLCYSKMGKRNTSANQQGEPVLESVWLFSILSKFNGVNGLHHEKQLFPSNKPELKDTVYF